MCASSPLVSPRLFGSVILALRFSSIAFRMTCLCPVAAVEELLRLRRAQDFAHRFLFSSLSAPHPPISVSAFSGLIRWMFRRAGIAAPPGSTRVTSVSGAIAGGVCVDDALRAGDWTCVQTFFRLYLRPSGSSGRQ